MAARFADVDLVIASDVDNPLLGINGATKIYGPQKGLPEERLVVVDGWLQHFAELTNEFVTEQSESIIGHGYERFTSYLTAP